MTKLVYKAMIEDMQNDKCTDREIEALVDVFTRIIRKAATTLARKSWFELKDFATSKEMGINHFTLMLERKKVIDQEQWWGILSVMASV